MWNFILDEIYCRMDIGSICNVDHVFCVDEMTEWVCLSVENILMISNNGYTWSSQTLYMSMYNDIELSSGHHYLDFLICNKK